MLAFVPLVQLATAMADGVTVTAWLVAPALGESIKAIVEMIIPELRIPLVALLTLVVIWGGFQLMTSGGDQRRSQAARSTIFAGLAGAFLIWFGPEVAALVIAAFGAQPGV